MGESILSPRIPNVWAKGKKVKIPSLGCGVGRRRNRTRRRRRRRRGEFSFLLNDPSALEAGQQEIRPGDRYSAVTSLRRPPRLRRSLKTRVRKETQSRLVVLISASGLQGEKPLAHEGTWSREVGKMDP